MQRSAPASRRTGRVLIALASTVLLAASIAIMPATAGADGTETLGPPSIPIAAGTGTVVGGVGLRNAQRADIVLDVPTDVTVEQVLVYWEGHASSDTAGFDDDIGLNGTNVVGTLIGGPTRFFQSNWSSTYRADITALGLVSPGLNTIAVDGLNYDLRNNGAGILVITSAEARSPPSPFSTATIWLSSASPLRETPPCLKPSPSLLPRSTGWPASTSSHPAWPAKIPQANGRTSFS